MKECLQFYINGKWVDPVQPKTMDVINPATEEVVGRISLGSAADVDKAVAAARTAFETFGHSSREERIALLERIIGAYQAHMGEMAETISLEVLKNYEFVENRGTTRILHEPIGVCGFITPWNWPVNQIACKVAPALAAGCTMVLKPTEIAPLNGVLWAEIMHEAGVPAGVFNLINGDGPTVGAAIAAHPGVDMVSFTGSTRA